MIYYREQHFFYITECSRQNNSVLHYLWNTVQEGIFQALAGAIAFPDTAGPLGRAELFLLRICSAMPGIREK